jgi:hypothetical protein
MISPISTGLVMWWFGIMAEKPPERLGTETPISASMTSVGSVVPAFSTAFDPHIEADHGGLPSGHWSRAWGSW